MISNDDKYYHKYLKYKQKYELVNNMNGGMSWLFGSTPKSNVEEDIYKYLLRHSYFDLFFKDIPEKLRHIQEKYVNISLTQETTYQTDKKKPRRYNEYDDGYYYETNEPQQQTVLLTDSDIKNTKKLVLWKISNIIYSELFADKQYQELNYNNRMTNLKSYIIVVIIRKIFQTEASSTTSEDYNIDDLIVIFKRIGLYIYLKLYQLLHYHGNVQFKYISNNYASKYSANDIQKLINNIKKTIDLFTEVLSSKNKEESVVYNSQIKNELLKLYDIDLNKTDGVYIMGNKSTSNLDQAIINSLELIQKNKTFQNIISMEDTYFFNAFIELTVTQTIYDKYSEFKN